jgi:hypothetical protein
MDCSLYFPSTPNRDRHYRVFRNLIYISFIYLGFFFWKCGVWILGVESPGWRNCVVVKLGNHWTELCNFRDD